MPVITIPPATGTWHQALNTGGGGGDILESVVGAGDEIEAITVESDGKYVHFINNNANADFAAFSVNFDVGAVVPVGSVINSIQFVINHQYVGSGNVTVPSVWDSAQADPAFSASWPEDIGNTGTFAEYDQQVTPGNPMPGGGVFVQWEATATMVPLDPDRGYYPFTSLPWTRDDLIAAYFGTFFGLNGNPEEYNIDYVALIVDYTPSTAPTATLDQLPVEIVYDFSILASLPFVCALASGTLPPGVTLNPDCTLTGTPTTTGTTPFVVVVTGPGWPVHVPVTLPTVAGVPINQPVAPPLPPGAGGGGIPHGPGECAGVAYGEGVIVSPGAIAGTGDPMSTVSIDLKQFFGGVVGAPPPLGFLWTYAAGSSTPLDTFANSALSVANTNPVQLDADGNPPNVIYLGPFIYKFDLQDAAGNSLPGFPIDNIAGSVWPGQVLGAVTVNPIANADGIGHSLSATLNKSNSGTHALFALLKLLAPTIGAGSASLTEAATLYVAGAPLGGTNRYAVHVAQGDIKLTDSASKIGFFGKTPIAQPLLATGAGHTVDDVITVLQALGLCKQS